MISYYCLFINEMIYYSDNLNEHNIYSISINSIVGENFIFEIKYKWDFRYENSKQILLMYK